MAVELDVIQGVIKLKDEYTDTLETVQKNLKKFGGEHTEWVASLVSGEALVATAFVAAGAVVGAELIKLGNEAEEVGASIGKMGALFDIPVGALSDIRFAIKAAGGDFDSFGNSLFMFQKRIEDNASAVDVGLQKIGLSVNGIKDLRPDEQFLKISDALRGTGAEVNKSAVAFEIFGKQGRDILPLLLKPLSDLTEESAKLGDTWSERDVQAARAFRAELNHMAAETEEAWTVLGRDVAPVTNELTIAWNRMKLALANVALTAIELVSLKPIAGWLGDNALAAEEAAAKQDVINKAMALGAEEGIKYGDAVRYVNEHYDSTANSVDKAAKKLEELREKAWVPLSSAQEDEILELQKFGVAVKDISELTGVNAVAIHTFTEAHKEQEAAIKKSAAASQEWEKVMADLNSVGKTWKDTLTQIDGEVVEAVKYYLAAGVSQSELAKAYGLTAVQVKDIDDALKSQVESTKAADKAAKDWAATLQAVEFGSKTLKEQIDTIDGSVVVWAEHLLESGVAARDVAKYYGLTDDQVRALEGDIRKASSALTDQSTSVNTVTSAVKILDNAWVTNADIAAETINKTTVKIRTLNGELISLAEAQKRQQTGGSFDVTSANFDQALRNFVDPIIGIAAKQYRDPYALAKAGYSFAEVIKYAFSEFQQGPLPPPQGPRIPGFAEGGVVDIRTGENGPETVRVPLGTTVFPTGTGPAPSTTNIKIDIHAMGTTTEAANAIGEHIMRKLKAIVKFGSA